MTDVPGVDETVAEEGAPETSESSVRSFTVTGPVVFAEVGTVVTETDLGGVNIDALISGGFLTEV